MKKGDIDREGLKDSFIKQMNTTQKEERGARDFEDEEGEERAKWGLHTLSYILEPLMRKPFKEDK